MPFFDGAKIQQAMAGTPNYFARNYTINRRLSAFVDVINVFDSRTFDDYQYIEDRPLRTFKFSTYLKMGVSGRF